MATQQTRHPTFTVIDALDAPHGGRILRLKLVEGKAPGVRALKGARLRATGPGGEEREVHVEGFSLFGGKPSDTRIARTGRVDVHVTESGEGPPVSLRWQVRPAS